jgi:hypothetical protein
MLALSLLDWQCLIMADDHEPAPQTLGMSPPLFQATTQDDESIAQMIALLDIQDAQMIALLDIQDAQMIALLDIQDAMPSIPVISLHPLPSCGSRQSQAGCQRYTWDGPRGRSAQGFPRRAYSRATWPPNGCPSTAHFSKSKCSRGSSRPR